MNLTKRPRRLRTTTALRSMVRETRISKSSLVYPMFIREGSGISESISAMPGQYRYSPDTVNASVGKAAARGVNAVLLFGIPETKDDIGSGAWDDAGAVQSAVRAIKSAYPDMLVITDVCLCEYTSHGHCGVLRGNTVDNDATLELLAKAAASHARAGADIVAPSDMMDGRVAAIREALDGEGYIDTVIMSYAVKYASAFYGPFREAAGSAPSFGDRKSYQMDCHNSREAVKEALTDIGEGADMLIVKPALSYLDVISDVSAAANIPVAAYAVSGEYAMIKSAAQAGYIDEAQIVCETAVAAYRAGADIYITYYAPELAAWIDEGRIG